MFIGTEKLTHVYMPGTPFTSEALRDVSFGLEKGAFGLIIGPSGSGKSTLVQHLNGLLKPTKGRIIFDNSIIGLDKQELLRLRRRIGLVFQMPEDNFFTETVYDEIAFAPRNLGFTEDETKNKVFAALETVGLDARTFCERHPFRLSSGQKRLVAIAAVLSLQPEVLILDEPTAGLDASAGKRLFALLADLNRSRGLTIIIATHHLNEAAVLAQVVLVLNRGVLVMSGPPGAVFADRNKLHGLGLTLPTVTDIMHSLADKGLPLSRDIYTLEEARREINKLARRNG